MAIETNEYPHGATQYWRCATGSCSHEFLHISMSQWAGMGLVLNDIRYIDLLSAKLRILVLHCRFLGVHEGYRICHAGLSHGAQP